MELKGHVVDVLNERIFDGCVCVENGKIADVKALDAPLAEDAPYVMPGFVDGHIHIESSMLVPENFAKEAVRHGTVGTVSDPHEIANVLGMEGVRFMVENSKRVPFHFWFGAPSCVPATNMEHSGAVLGPAEVRELLEDPDIHYLSELMFAYGVVIEVPDVMEKVKAAKDNGKPIDGHSPGMKGDDLKKYIAAGVSTDHECIDVEEALERIKGGMRVQIREGSAAKNYSALAPVIKDYPDMLMFSSDDLHPQDLVKGHIDRLVRRAVADGYPLWNVLKIACVTPVRHYGMPCGLLQKGDNADFILVDNLKDFNVIKTYINGEDCSWAYEESRPVEVLNNFHALPIKEEDIAHDVAGDEKVKVIVAEDYQLYTGMEIVDRSQVGIENDILKIVVYNRYSPAKPVAAFIKGFGLKKGAICSTVAHDSHNIIAIGADDKSLTAAINHMIELKGGATVFDGSSFKDQPLPVAGLLSTLGAAEVGAQGEMLQEVVKGLGCTLEAPFMTMGFMALPVIPNLKITDSGLVEFRG